MKKNITLNNGPLNDGDGHSVAELLAALSTSQYQHLAAFARWRLRAVTNSRWLQQCLAGIGAEDLVNEALLKVLLGADNPTLGRHLKGSHLADIDTFLVAVKGIIVSDLSNVVSSARNRSEHLIIGDPEEEPGAVELANPEDPHKSLLRRDLRQVLFAELYERIRKKPALLAAVQDWEQRFLEDDHLGAKGLNPNWVYRVRQLTQDILADLATEFAPAGGDGKEMLI